MKPLYTIGHSTRPIGEFIELLQAHQITQIVDIRTIPKSRHNPQFEQQALAAELKKAGITYVYLEKLGGLRPSVKNSINGAWRNKSFRNYADYMQTTEFEQGISELISLSQKSVTAIMCAEAVPWRCHRSLVGDALVVRHIPVYDIISITSMPEHTITSFAVVSGTTVTYPKPADDTDSVR
jgi:uncharacterized protein (DUF488 family)